MSWFANTFSFELMEEDPSVFLSGRRMVDWLEYVTLAAPKLCTAQPQLFCYFVKRDRNKIGLLEAKKHINCISP